MHRATDKTNVKPSSVGAAQRVTYWTIGTLPDSVVLGAEVCGVCVYGGTDQGPGGGIYDTEADVKNLVDNFGQGILDTLVPAVWSFIWNNFMCLGTCSIKRPCGVSPATPT